MAIDAAVFDFDLTLADSTAGAVECSNHALRRLGLPAADPAAIRRTIGLPLPRAFHALTGADDPARGEAFATCFIERADEVMVDLTALFPDVPEMLARLRDAEVRTAIVSTKFRRRIEGILARENLRGAFDAIVGGEDVARLKPDPEGLRRVLGALDVPGARAVYVGDHPIDAEAAARAGVRFVAVLTGCSCAEDFAGFEVARLLPSLAPLPWALAGL
jgi:phosphoglycolate phosphatase